MGRGGIQIAEDLRFVSVTGAIDIPAIAEGAPAIHIEAPENRLAGCRGDLIVTINLGVNFLHPAGFVMLRRIFARGSAAFPVVEAITLRHVERKIVQRARNAIIDPIFVNVKARIKIDAAKLVRAVDVSIMIATRTDVQRNPVHSAGISDRRQHLVLILHPGQRLAIRRVVGAIDILGP